MNTVTKSIVVAVPLATAVRRWPRCEQSVLRHVPDAVPSFQSLTDDRTRVILSVAHHHDTPPDVLEVLLEDELEGFKQSAEADDSTGVMGLLRRLLS